MDKDDCFVERIGPRNKMLNENWSAEFLIDQEFLFAETLQYVYDVDGEANESLRASRQWIKLFSG